jgi:hypothetical protein
LRGGFAVAPFSSSVRERGRCSTQTWSCSSTATPPIWPNSQLFGSGFGQDGRPGFAEPSGPMLSDRLERLRDRAINVLLGLEVLGMLRLRGSAEPKSALFRQFPAYRTKSPALNV